jgi:holin-like protein
VLGLAILLAGLFLAGARGKVSPETVDDTEIGKVAGVLLASLGLLFVPAGAGLVQHLDLVARHGPALLAALVGSTLVTLIATVGVFRLVARRRERRP